MRENFQWIGKPKDEEDKQKALIAAANLLAKGAEKLPGEEDKTEENIQMITNASQWVSDLFDSYGIQIQPIELNRVHFLSHEKFVEIRKNSAGFYSGMYHSLVIDEGLSKPEQIKTLIHELIHSQSFSKVSINTNTHDLDTQRTGFEFSNNTDASSHVHFKALNEGIVDSLAIECAKKYKNEIARTFNLTEDEYKNFFAKEQGYVAVRELFEEIVATISEKAGIQKEEFRRMMVSSLVSGELTPVFRLIENILGPGSLRVIGAFPSTRGEKRHGMKDVTYGNTIRLIKKYLSSDDQREKNSIALQLLNERERFAYKNHVEKMKDTESNEGN